MDKNRWKRIERLFQEALEHPEEERLAFLQKQCAGDEALLAEVAELLDNVNEGAALEQVVMHAARDVVESERLAPGTRIGPFAITREIGRGGMGTVYLAERVDGHFEQKVAIKLVTGGRVSQGRLARFRDERQILANLEQSHIARLLDGGTTEDDMPFLVMEYVDGQPIDEYCEVHGLTVRQRLDLFLKICHAVQYAHQKLVIHSDIKPSNILVTGEGEPRLVDFGIAHLLDAPGVQDASASANRAMTPGYSSPEQVQGQPVNTMSDVYALGALLHKILTGSVPASAAEVTESELARMLPRDLACIVLKALQEDPDDRYSSASQLADDIDRYLGQLPVSARADTWAYRAARVFARNRISSALAAIFVLAVIGFSVVTLVQSRQVAAERDTAQIERARSDAVSEFLVDSLLSVNPTQAQGEDITVREILDNAADQLEQDEHALIEQPAVEATLQRLIGMVYQNLGLLDDARVHLNAALEYHRQNPEGDDAERFLVLLHLSNVASMSFEHKATLPLLEEALEIAMDIYGPEHRHTLGTLSNIAGTNLMMNNFDTAEAQFEELYDRRVALLGREHPDTINALNNLGVVAQWQGDNETARSVYRQCVEIGNRALGERHPRVIGCLGSLGSAEEAMGEYEAAQRVLTRHIDLATEVFGPNSPNVLRSMHNLADTLRGLGRYAASEQLFLETLDRRRMALGPDHIETLQSEIKLARLYRLMERYDEARALVVPAERAVREQLGPEHSISQMAGEQLSKLNQADPQ